MKRKAKKTKRTNLKIVHLNHAAIARRDVEFIDRIIVRGLELGLIDALAFYDRVAGNVRNDSGLTAEDVRRLAELRAMAIPLKKSQEKKS